MPFLEHLSALTTESSPNLQVLRALVISTGEMVPRRIAGEGLRKSSSQYKPNSRSVAFPGVHSGTRSTFAPEITGKPGQLHLQDSPQCPHR
jgi:hypothetical protein